MQEDYILRQQTYNTRTNRQIVLLRFHKIFNYSSYQSFRIIFLGDTFLQSNLSYMEINLLQVLVLDYQQQGQSPLLA